MPNGSQSAALKLLHFEGRMVPVFQVPSTSHFLPFLYTVFSNDTLCRHETDSSLTFPNMHSYKMSSSVVELERCEKEGHI